MTTSLPTTLWAAQVAAATRLPDARLNTRLQQLLVHFDNKPLDAIPQAMNDGHQAKAAYRFLSNERFDACDLLAGLKNVTAQMLRGQSVVYVAHDTTTFQTPASTACRRSGAAKEDSPPRASTGVARAFAD